MTRRAGNMILIALMTACAPGTLVGPDPAMEEELDRFSTAHKSGGSLTDACAQLNKRCQTKGQGCKAYKTFCGGAKEAICNKLKAACATHPKACAIYNSSCSKSTPVDGGAPAPSSDGAAPSTPPGSTPPPPATGTCTYPKGDPPGAKQIGNQKLKAGQVLENFVLHSSGGHAITPPNVKNTVVRNGSVYASGGDNIKLGDDSSYENLYLVMSQSGGHIDALQGQGATGVTIKNVTVAMTSHSGVTGAILFQTLKGGGGDVHNDVTFDINCLKLVGTGPYGHDIRVDYKNGAKVTGRITNVQMTGNILITNRGGGGACKIEVDATALSHVKNNGCVIVPI